MVSHDAVRSLSLIWQMHLEKCHQEDGLGSVAHNLNGKDNGPGGKVGAKWVAKKMNATPPNLTNSKRE